MTSMLSASNAGSLAGGAAPVASAIGGAALAATPGLGQAYLALQGLSAITSIASGIAGMKATGSEAERLNGQADLAIAQARRDALLTAQNVRSFREEQASGYLNSGVTLEGSPMAVLSQTVTRGQQEIDSIKASGEAQSKLLRMQASQTQRAGVFNAVSSTVSGATGFATAAFQGQRLGILGNSKASLVTTGAQP
jgi:hypothetical protein